MRAQPGCLFVQCARRTGVEARAADMLLDEVERDILKMSESRAEGGMQPVKNLVHTAIGMVPNDNR